MYAIEFVEEAIQELRRLRAAERRRLVDAIEEQLQHRPASQNRRRKMLVGLVPPWGQIRPVWQLRVGEFRIFYDVDEESTAVVIRAVRRKGRGRTEEVL